MKKGNRQVVLTHKSVEQCFEALAARRGWSVVKVSS